MAFVEPTLPEPEYVGQTATWEGRDFIVETFFGDLWWMELIYESPDGAIMYDPPLTMALESWDEIPGDGSLPDPSDETVLRFTYWPPTEEQAERMQVIRDACLELATIVEAYTLVCREQELAITSLEQVSMWANAAIVRREEVAS